ncbi:hypothetical protein SCHPADRAFT_860940 [Schizopora paradoxa]|uniref:BTB domain-containing protein n=1 Tax=Schizopora paradoxa TaxID=27342 RepID=A0A0H2R644_9AGAM|nr:hypothetical protein SCHPADRAFT_860940 [Schizopora paradoxa]
MDDSSVFSVSFIETLFPDEPLPEDQNSVSFTGTPIPDETVPLEQNWISNLKRDENLWFEDGSIVLATDVHLFCVHKSLLAKNSSIFRDMLEMPSGGESDSQMVDGEDYYEGKPIVKMVGDSDDDVRYLLMALYNHNFFRANNPTTPSIFSSLLYASSKYDVPVILQEVVEQLKSYYPTELSKLRPSDRRHLVRGEDSTEDKDAITDFNPAEFAFKMLGVAVQADIKEQLPMMYFECAIYPIKRIMSLSKQFSLGSGIVETLLAGREKLSKYPYSLAANVFSPQLRCNDSFCGDARSKAFFDRVMNNLNSPDFNGSFILVEASSRSSFVTEELCRIMCENCFKRADAAHAEGKLNV